VAKPSIAYSLLSAAVLPPSKYITVLPGERRYTYPIGDWRLLYILNSGQVLVRSLPNLYQMM